MITGSLKHGVFEMPLYNGHGLSIESVTLRDDEHKFSTLQPQNHLRFLYNVNAPYQIDRINNEHVAQFVPERSAVKVHPGVALKLQGIEGSEIIVMNFYGGERQYLDHIVSTYGNAIANMKGREATEWSSSISQPLDYVGADEKNGSLIITKYPGIVIAPNASKFSGSAHPVGWIMREVRASKVVGIGLNYEWQVRGPEENHTHAFSHELYVSLHGSTNLFVNGTVHELKAGQVINCEPGEMRYRVSLGQVPWHGLTIQIPSIGDKILPKDVVSKHL